MISIVIKLRRSPNRFFANDKKNITENVYFKEAVSKSNDNVLSKIVDSTNNLLSNGTFIDETKIAVVNSNVGIDKEKALDYLHISALKAEASNNEELISAANIVENFENPCVGTEKMRNPNY